jgi:hypothetical protein
MRDSATYALSVIKIPEAVPLLERAMEDPYEGIRIKAKRGLQALAAKSIAGAAEVLARHPGVKDEESLEDFLRLGEMELSSMAPLAAAESTSPALPPPAATAPLAPTPAANAQPAPVAATVAPTPVEATRPAPAEGESPPVPESPQQKVLPPPKGTYELAAPDPTTRILEVLRAVAAEDLGVGPLLLERLATEDDNKVKATLAVALGRLGYEVAVDSLIALLEDTDPRIRANAVEGLGLLKAESTHRPLIMRLKDPHQRVVANALWSLREYPHIDIYPHLESMSGHRKEEFRRSAIWLMTKLGTFTAVKMLEKMAQTDRSSDIKSRATKALGLLRDAGNSIAKSSCQKLRVR